VLPLIRSGVLAHLWFAGRERDKEGHDTTSSDASRCSDGRLTDQRDAPGLRRSGCVAARRRIAPYSDIHDHGDEHGDSDAHPHTH
jgi:hypothetical protein